MTFRLGMRYLDKLHNLYGFGIEIFTTLIIIFASLLIYYKTKEIYELSEHRGLKFFRKGFLYLAFAHIIKIMIIILRPDFIADTFRDRFIVIGVFVFFSLIGILYLLLSILSKKIKEYYIYLITILVIITAWFFSSPFLIVIYATAIVSSLGIISYIKYKKSKKKVFSQIYIIYILLFLLVITYLFGVAITRIFDLGRYYMSILTAIFFMYILYRVLKRLTVK